MGSRPHGFCVTGDRSLGQMLVRHPPAVARVWGVFEVRCEAWFVILLCCAKGSIRLVTCKVFERACSNETVPYNYLRC